MVSISSYQVVKRFNAIVISDQNSKKSVLADDEQHSNNLVCGTYVYICGMYVCGIRDNQKDIPVEGKVKFLKTSATRNGKTLQQFSLTDQNE